MEQIRKRVQPQVSRLSADSVGHSDQNKTCLASEVVETWQSVWRMSCSRARRLDDVLQQVSFHLAFGQAGELSRLYSAMFNWKCVAYMTFKPATS